MDQYPDPALVGKAFVKQYYTQMHKDPTQMHRFYLEQSSFVHGGSEIGSEEPVIGQKAIHEKITSLDLKHVHAKIKQVDSHATLGSGIVVQVTGELSISRHPMRAFVQTFVLAPEQPKKYYVHNDIFRYQDDDLVSESETNEALGDGENPALIDQVVTDEYRADKNTSGEGVGGEDVRGVYDSQSAELGDSSVNLPVEDVPQQSDLTTPTWNQFDSGHLGEVTQNGMDVDTSSPQTTQEFPSANEPVEVRQDEETFSMGGPQEQENKASTWASRLAQNQQQSSGNRPHNSTAISSSQSLPQREQRPRRTDNRQPAQTSSTSIKDTSKKPGSGAPTSRDAPDSHQIFVGNLPAGTSKQELMNLFGKYGNVCDARVNPKNFAFVVFDSPDPVNKLIASKEPPTLNDKALNVEPKRRSAGRGDRDRNRAGPGGQGGKSRGGKPTKR